MAIEKHEISSYAVSIVSAKRGPAAIIHAVAASDSGASVHIYLRYYRSRESRPVNSRMESDDGSLMYMINYRFEQLPPSVDLLRHEKPMFFVYNTKSDGAYLATDAEPIGEGSEADGMLSDSREIPLDR